MTPNRQSPAYALFARRPIVPQPPDVLAADPPASQEPLPPSGTEDTPVTECPLPAPAVAAAWAPIVKRPRQKAAKADLDGNSVKFGDRGESVSERSPDNRQSV
jgi:hypothetical protein